MRSPASSHLPAACFLAMVCGALPAHAQQSTAQTIQARVHFDPRTSLTVSTSLLHFEHLDPAAPTAVTVDFTARARAHAAGEVVLTVEPVRTIEGPGGAADVETSISFAGEGAGTLEGVLSSSGPSVVGRWRGSGAREGRVVFSLRAGASGQYSLPVRFVLTAP